MVKLRQVVRKQYNPIISIGLGNADAPDRGESH